MEAAITEAAKSRCRQRHGCVIVHRGQILSRANNVLYPSPNPMTDSWRESIHAEMAAIGQLGTVPKGARLYVARVSPTLEPVFSAPCKKCWGFIRRTGITSVFWT